MSLSVASREKSALRYSWVVESEREVNERWHKGERNIYQVERQMPYVLHAERAVALRG